ncbi:hypothetical protein [Alteribacillus bidgolensis]|uniref:Uncharacterized protein n=1 Tax=Alteribacillus bidgolensis TaxID=930129 RepID=A0A1G8GY09_9BACI|nr:hypothetical protein [Alteribacillus bidgolensis]SDH99283.1 hypothetical protein SAMN05216352_10418 [Alteribacillus bidgolensis]
MAWESHWFYIAAGVLLHVLALSFVLPNHMFSSDAGSEENGLYEGGVNISNHIDRTSRILLKTRRQQ